MSYARKEAEGVVASYATDVLPYAGVGISLTDIVEVAITEAMATALEEAVKIILAAQSQEASVAYLRERATRIRAEVRP